MNFKDMIIEPKQEERKEKNFSQKKVIKHGMFHRLCYFIQTQGRWEQRHAQLILRLQAEWK